VGGLWLCATRVPSGLRAVAVPSGLRVIFQPHWWTRIRWWKEHYADVRVMPMPGFPALVAGVRVLSGAA
jgi:hypothetical protein